MRLKASFTTSALALAVFFIPGSILRAQETSHKLTAMDEFQIQLPTDPQISPDGKKIVYVRRFADSATDKR
jgi:acylaminoacyl-peptidase